MDIVGACNLHTKKFALQYDNLDVRFDKWLKCEKVAGQDLEVEFDPNQRI
jgi:hypothetical protein